MENQHLFTGTGTALVTPFTADDDIDERALRRLIDRQIASGVDALIMLGTTGENPTIEDDERRRIVDLSLEAADGRVPVIIGTGTNSTRQSVQFSKEAARAGANGLLVVGPYYNKPTQAGFRAHVQAIADATDCPQIIYNVPGRTSFNVTAETMLRLAEEVPSVVGAKEASGDLAQISDILVGRPDDLAVYAGDDEITLPLLALGGDGVVSVISNALPNTFSAMVRTALDGGIQEAHALHFRMLQTMRACFYETNPIPIKTVLAEAGLVEEQFRLPIARISDEERKRVRKAFSHFDELSLELETERM